MVHDLIIIGSGPAGLTAAIYAARANLKPLLFAGFTWGGQLMNTTEVENFPGFIDGILGPELMQNMIKQAERFGTEIKYEDAVSLDLSGEIKKVKSDSGEEFEAKAIIIATGASPRKLGVPGEDTFWAKGVSSCATCDGAFFKDKVTSVVGGGDSAMEEALYLTRFASKVYVFNRSSTLKASKIMQEKAMSNPKIEIIYNTEVREIKGDTKVTGLKLFNNKENIESEIALDAMFLGIGQIPVTAYLNNQLELNENGYIKSEDGVHTSVEGVFVAGDVEDHVYRQAVTAAGSGCKASLVAERWLTEKHM